MLWTIWAIVSSAFVFPILLTFYLPFLTGISVLTGSGSGFIVGTLVWFITAILRDEAGGVAAFAENCVNDSVVIKGWFRCCSQKQLWSMPFSERVA